MKRKLAIGTVMAAAAAMTLSLTGPAYAAGPSGAEACPAGNFCLYYNSPQNGWGSFEHWSLGSYTLTNYTFRNWGNGSGYGQNVANNAASVVNNTDAQWGICTGVTCETFQPGFAGVLPPDVYNQDLTMAYRG
ncbi:peptidase inhibitor family I36 protein [Streptomyces sp. NPDC059819]|uniref:peptidase inhibitor family I36 protein n=1 Tax=Streptomyces sp. NPDC059819 TaxID=3346963 RepID=UPI0036693B0E